MPAMGEVTPHPTFISVERFAIAFHLACQSIIQKEERINQLNVFPVSDKDTGTNLAMTLSEVSPQLSNNSTYRDYLLMVANTVFDNARGNSGVIFSIFIDALSSNATTDAALSIDSLIDLLENAYLHLCHEMQNVVEGTIITFMGDCVQLFRIPTTLNLLQQKQFEAIFLDLKSLLQKTQEQNPILAKNEVIDAGAYALYLFLKTFILSVPGNTSIHIESDTLDEGESVSFTEHEVEDYPSHRYCTEGKLQLKPMVDLDEIKAIINQSGDSELFLKRGNTLRFHVHANHPVPLTIKLLPYGTLKHPKIDDLYRQYQMIHHRKHDIAIVTDSSADLPTKLYDTYPIFQIAQSIHIGDNELLDRLNIDPDLLYELLPTLTHYPKTSAPTLGLIKYTIKVLKKYYKNILILTISSELSSTYNTIKTVAQYDDSIHVFDTLNNSGSHGFLIQYAAEMVEKKYEIMDIIKQLNKIRAATATFVVIRQIDAPIRSGRLPGLKGWIAKMLRIKPVLTLDEHGKGVIVSKSLTYRSAIHKILSIIKTKHEARPILYYGILHANAGIQTTSFREALIDIIGIPPMYIQSISPALGIHVGIGGIGISYFQVPMPSSTNDNATPSSREDSV